MTPKPQIARKTDRRVVVKDYRVAYPNPVQFVGGEEFAVGDEDTEYPGWLWVTTADGNSGWAPVQLIEPLEAGRGRGRMDYTAQEVDVSAGDAVEVLSSLNGWLWVRNPIGLEGWVPAEHVGGTAEDA